SRPETMQRLHLQMLANNSPQVKQLSTFQKIADSRSQLSVPLQAKTDNSAPVQRVLKVNKQDYDVPSIIARLKSDRAVVWRDAYIPILEELDAANAQFDTEADLLLRVGSIMVARRAHSQPANNEQPGAKPVSGVEYKEEALEYKEKALDQKDKAVGSTSPSGKSVQEMLTKEYWKKRLESKDSKLYAKTQEGDYFKKYPAAKEEVRNTKDIIERIGPQLLTDIEQAGKISSAQLKLYRTMPVAEADGIMAWFGSKKEKTESEVRNKKLTAADLNKRDDVGIMPISGHLGDADQALSYYEAGESMDEQQAAGKKVVLEFILKPGAHDVLFNPQYMALARAGKANAVVAEVAGQEGRGAFPAGSRNEGNLPGYIGVKPERRGDFSISMGKNKVTPLLFQLLIADIKIVSQSPSSDLD
ncbi:MAG: hypothetical protein ACOYXT_28600, partial [Bacteroidota bacterium]